MTPRPPWRVMAAGLCAVGVGAPAACARQGTPPGGPPDERPPVVIAVEPDTFAFVETGSGDIRIRFDERISERPMSGALDDAVHISPLTGDVRVEHKRDALEITLNGGFRPDIVYRVTLDPVMRDMFGNSMRVPFEWVFSTGPAFPQNAIGGLVWDRLTGDGVEDVAVLLRAEGPASDSALSHVASSDTAGIFALRYLPPGTYAVAAFQDRNRNGSADPFELQGSATAVTVGEADTAFTVFSVMVPDTTPPRAVRVEALDSLTIEVSMDDFIDPAAPLGQVVSGVIPEDGSPPAMARILHEYQWPAYQDTLQAIADSLRRLAADSAAAAAAAAPAEAVVDTTGAQLPAAQAQIQAAPPQPLRGPGAPVGPPPAREFLPDGSRIPSRVFIIRLVQPLLPGAPYLVRLAGVPNLVEMLSAPEEVAVTLPIPPPPDTADAAADTTGLPPDTNRVALRPRRR